jgi:hypothetical protein
MFGPTHFLYADTMFALGNIQLKQADLSKRKEEQGQAKEVTTWMWMLDLEMDSPSCFVIVL